MSNAKHHPMLPLENPIATPHTAANTMESRNRAGVDCVPSILAYEAEPLPQFAVNRLS